MGMNPETNRIEALGEVDPAHFAKLTEAIYSHTPNAVFHPLLVRPNGQPHNIKLSCRQCLYFLESRRIELGRSVCCGCCCFRNTS